MRLKEIFKHLTSQLAGSDVFIGHGTAIAEDEIILLLMAVLQVDFEVLNGMSDESVDEKTLLKAQDLLQKRISTRQPMAYVVGFSVFAGLRFTVDERVLIPRSPFAELIDQGFAPFVTIDRVHRVLDLCTGGGCIGLAIAHYFPHLTVDLADISGAALAVAKANQESLQLNETSHLIESDVFSNINARYDLIVTNPPYVSATEYADLPQEFSHEPEMALVSAAEGLLIPVKILAKAAQFMSYEGYLFLEVGYNDHVLQAQFPAVDFNWLSFDHGGQGICVFSRQDLLKYQALFEAFLQQHVA